MTLYPPTIQVGPYWSFRKLTHSPENDRSRERFCGVARTIAFVLCKLVERLRVRCSTAHALLVLLRAPAASQRHAPIVLVIADARNILRRVLLFYAVLRALVCGLQVFSAAVLAFLSGAYVIKTTLYREHQP